MSEDETGPPKDESVLGRRCEVPPPPFDPDYELIGYLEEREGEAPNLRGR